MLHVKTLPLLFFLMFLSFSSGAKEGTSAATADTLSDAEDDAIFVVNRSSSLKKLKQTLAETRNAHNRRKEGITENEIGDYYWYAGDYPLAAEHYYSALHIFEQLKDSLQISLCYRNVGWIYMGQKNYGQTKKYFTQSLDLLNRLGRKRELIPAYDDLGIMYRETKNYTKSIDCFNESIRLAKLYNKDAIGTSIISLARSYREMGRYQKAIVEYGKAIALQQHIKDPYNLSYAYIDLGRCYIALKDGDKSVRCLLKARDMAHENNYGQVEIEAIRYLGPAYKLQGNYEQAYHFSNRFAELTDSLENDKQDREVKEMMAKYESVKKENYIRNLQKQKEFSNEKLALSNEKLAQEERFKLWLLLFLGVVLALAYFFFRSFRQKQRANQQLSLTYAELATKNKDIEDSINYARQIQQARLPDPAFIRGLFPESFVLFKPKDVVSGDFYWFADLKNGNISFAAADCTGHGIPGAFMSLIGIDTIYQAVIDKRIDNPSQALSAVNVSLKKTLRQNEHNSSSRDGMDVALCQFDTEKRLLSYAGAHRPLFVIRNGELTEIKATKHSIGGLTSDQQHFEGHSTTLQDGDTVYIFSDGYADQFGGTNNKKFSTRRFRELLLSIHQLPAAEQHSELDRHFEDWKGGHEQIDDVLVIGIRF